MLSLVIFCASALMYCRADIIANFVMPHGGIALDPSHFNSTNSTAVKQAWELHRACVEVGDEIASLQPDLIVLSTPHGIADLKNFIFYLNPVASGYADTDNCNCPPCCYNVTVNVDVEMTEELVTGLGYRNVSGLSGYGPPGGSSEPFPLRWGEVIPFHFVPKLNCSKVAILSQPSRRYKYDVEMIPELLRLGAGLFDYLEKTRKRVVVIISADLAHTHQASGPYGYSNTSEPFDLAIGKWASNLDPEALLTTAASLVDRALSCGFTGMVMLHGLMERCGLSSWKPSLRVNHHPSYYGMMVASFYRNTEGLIHGVDPDL
ncbi:protein TTE1956 [Aplysia californica]|uniref:Protein TTE1956 n=1 Tax=Aplysia californica TaxID=6500 RepID=A0ABM0KAL5_APLCA|nr:protein TTE1956 [Aplysia californica]